MKKNGLCSHQFPNPNGDNNIEYSWTVSTVTRVKMARGVKPGFSLVEILFLSQNLIMDAYDWSIQNTRHAQHPGVPTR